MRKEIQHSTLGQGTQSLSFTRTCRPAGWSTALAGILILLLLAMGPGTADAKSLYVITSIVMTPIPVRAYDVSADGNRRHDD